MVGGKRCLCQHGAWPWCKRKVEILAVKLLNPLLEMLFSFAFQFVSLLWVLVWLFYCTGIQLALTDTAVRKPALGVSAGTGMHSAGVLSGNVEGISLQKLTVGFPASAARKTVVIDAPLGLTRNYSEEDHSDGKETGIPPYQHWLGPYFIGTSILQLASWQGGTSALRSMLTFHQISSFL